MWTCPKCKRDFKAKNQWHSCVIVKAEELFFNTPPVVSEIYSELLKRCDHLGNIKIDTTKSCLYFVDYERFLALKPKKNGLILEFLLNRSVDIFPVIKVLETGKLRYAHRVMLDDPEDITEEVLSWIEEAHGLLQK